MINENLQQYWVDQFGPLLIHSSNVTISFAPFADFDLGFLASLQKTPRRSCQNFCNL